MTLSDRVRRTVRTHGLFAPGSRVAVALSGGADSVALVYLLRELEASGDVVLAGLAHFNHQIRGADADADEAFCREMAARLNLPIEVGRADVRTSAREEGRSVEDAARTLRYEFLERARQALGADVVAVAHTLDDQAETFLLRLLRGAGPRGLAGIHPRAGTIVRPLIDVRRSDLREWLAERAEPHREDVTNADVRIPRNRIRHELIPYLERHFSPSIVTVLAREASIAREDEARLAAEAIELADSIVLRSTDHGPGVVSVDPRALTALPGALASRVARIALEAGAPGRFAGYDQIERFLEFARTAVPGAAMDLPGQRAVVQDGRIVLGPALPRRRETAGVNSFRFPLSIPGEVLLEPQGWLITAAEAEAGPATGPDELTAVLSRDAVKLPLIVRSRAPGDRVQVAGMGGRHRKVQDVFVDRKVPRALRDSVPLVVDSAGQIVWVVGEPVAEAFRPAAGVTGVILLIARRLSSTRAGPSPRRAAQGEPGA